MIPFDLDRLQRETFVRHIVYLEETGSTNTVALNLAESELERAPILVLAARQTAGRGRGGNHWWSSEGALTFSVVVDGDATCLPRERRSLASLATGLAVADAIASLMPQAEVGVKWPNDVHLNGKKVSGILVESAGRGDRLVIGVGINVNNSLTDAPSEIAERAISLVDFSGALFNLSRVLTLVLQQLYRRVMSPDSELGLLIEDLRRRCVLTGRRVVIEVGQERVGGLCCGLDEDGALLVSSHGGVRRIIAGVVTALE